MTATGGTIALSSSGNILGSVTVASGALTVGKPGAGNYLSTAGGLYVTGAGVLAAGPGASATIVGNIDYSSRASSTYSGQISGSGSVLTLAAATGTTLTLSGTASSTFGGIAIQGGMLKIANSAALTNNPLAIDGGTLDLGGLANVALASLTGDGGTIETSSGTSTLVVSPSAGTTSVYSGSIIDGAGMVSLLKEGAGELILSGSDSFSGGTTVADGLLDIGNTQALPYGGSLTVGSGGTFACGVGILPASSGVGVSPASVILPASATAGSRAGQHHALVYFPMECGDLSPLSDTSTVTHTS